MTVSAESGGLLDEASTDRLLTTTRSVRRRLDLDRPVDRSVVLDCLRVALQAPIGTNAQSWRWLVVTDADLRAKLADIYRRGMREYHKALVEFEATGFETSVDTGADMAPNTAQTERVMRSATHLARNLERVPVLVVPCLLGRLPVNADNFRAAAYYGSIFPAVWSFQLALRSRGLGSVLTTLHLTGEREAGALLGIPENVTQACLLPVAHYTGTDFRPATRRPLDEVVYWGRWGEPPDVRGGTGSGGEEGCG